MKLKRRWMLRAAATDPNDDVARGFVSALNESNERYWFKRSALESLYFYENMLGMPVRFYVVKDETDVSTH
jgi:hypothetical protein